MRRRGWRGLSGGGGLYATDLRQLLVGLLNRLALASIRSCQGRLGGGLLGRALQTRFGGVSGVCRKGACVAYADHCAVLQPDCPAPEAPAKPSAPATPLVAKTAAPAAASAPATGERFVVQVGAYADQARAREVRLKIERAGLKTYTQVAKTSEGNRIRVRLGPFNTRAEADKVAQKIKSLGLTPGVLTL